MSAHSRWIRLRNCVRYVLMLCVFALFAPMSAHAREVAPQVVLANVFPPNADPKAYLVSEKYDGVRAIWDGTTLRFRSGRNVPAPKWFIDKLPKGQALDGELWLGRRTFDELSGIVRTASPLGAEWQRVQYMIFELPNAPGTFSERYAAMQIIVANANFKQLKVVPQQRVRDHAELMRLLEQIVRDKGEGLMLHRADALYQTGRSDALLKLKPYNDAEATVIAHIAGRGKHKGKLGALRVRTEDGKEFKLGTGFSDATRAKPPPIGAVVTYAYRELTPKGIPRFARYLRVREDP